MCKIEQLQDVNLEKYKCEEMENLELAKKIAKQLEQANEDVPLRANGSPRSMTVMKMQWLAERVRKCQKIKQQVEEGTYNVPSEKVAKSILNLDQN